MRIAVVILLLLLREPILAQEFYAAPMQAMANTGLAIPSVYSTSINAASLTKLNNLRVGVAYQPHFLTNAIQSQALFLTKPLKRVNSVGFSLNNYGIPGTSTLLTIRGGYARSFGDFFSTSISANYHQYQVKGYGGDQAFSVDLGAYFTFNEMLALGMLLRNISSSSFDDNIEQYIPQEIGLGLLYSISEELFLTSDVYYNKINKLDPRIGLSYNMDKLLVLRGGVTLNPMRYFAGVGLAIKKMSIDISSSFHAHIGYSPQIALSHGF